MTRILNLFNRLFLLWIILGGIIAYLFPQLLLALKDYMEWFFAFTMFGVGMVLKPADFVNIFKNIKVVIIGVIAQFTIMPGLAWLVARYFGFSPELSLGLILAGSAPGAMASNVLSYLARADVAYSVSLTTVSTLLAPVLTPLLTLALAHTLLEIPFWNMFFSVVRMVLLPLVLGILVNHFYEEKLKPVATIFPAISILFITFICALVIALNRNFLPQINLWIFAGVILLNIGGMMLGYLTGKGFGFNLLRKRALSIEIGMQNAGLGSVLALKHFSEQVALPSAIFVFVCIITASMVVPIWAKNKEEVRF